MKCYCGNISIKCPHKTTDGVCKTDGYSEEQHAKCDFAVEPTSVETGFIIKHLYNIYNGTPSVIDTASGIHRTWPFNLYCSQIEKMCPYQTLGGKCNRPECLVYDQNCEHQIDLCKDTELMTRLLQRIHKRLEKQQKQIEKLTQKEK